jgi:O-antigen/teichoic acid export membrane protein
MLRLGRQTLIYGLSGVVPQLLGILTLPVVARIFTTAQYGVLELVTSAIAVVATLVELGLTSASQRSYFDYSDEQPDARRTVLSTAVITYMSAALVAAAVLILLSQPIAGFLLNNSNESDLIVIAAVSLPLTALMIFTREIMRLHFQAWHYLRSALLAGIVGTGFILFALLVLHMKVAGVLLSGVISAAIAAVYGMAVVRGDLGHRFSRPELRTMLAYGLPLVPTALALWALALIDRVMLSKLSSLSQVGEYAMANRLGLVLALAATAFALAFAPFMLSLYAEDREQEKLVRARALTYMSVAFALLTLVVSLFAREALKLIAPQFNTAYEAVGLVCFGLAANGIANIALGGIALARQTRSLFILAGAAASVNIALNIVVIPAWGMLGAAFATTVAYVLLFALYYNKAQRVYPTPYEPSRLIRLSALTAVGCAVGAIPIEPLYLALAVKSLVAVLFLLGLRVMGIVGSDEFAALRLVVRERAVI